MPTKKVTLPPRAKNEALDDALYNRDKKKAQKLFTEIKQYLTEGDRKAVAAKIAKLPATKAKK